MFAYQTNKLWMSTTTACGCSVVFGSSVSISNFSNPILALLLILFGSMAAITIDFVVIEKLFRLERNDSVNV